MAEHSDRSLRQIVFGSNRAAEHGTDSQRVKIVAADKHQLSQLQGSVHLRRQASLIDSNGLGKDLLLFKGLELGVTKAALREAYQFLWLRDAGKRPHRHGVDEAEYRRVTPNGKSQRQHGHGREPGV